MSCNDCFSNCGEITPDKCVRYTGADVNELGIENSTPLSDVNEKMIEGILSALNGEGISFDVGVLCDIIRNYLPTPVPTLQEITQALIQAVCELTTKVEALETVNESLASSYTINCFTPASSDIHDILQAAFTKICELETQLNGFKTTVQTNYVKISDLSNYLQI